MTDNWLNTSMCTGCGACVDKCPQKAISMIEDITGCIKPEIDNNLCISCYLCKKVCPNFNPSSYSPAEVVPLVGIYNNSVVEKASSSGGIFAALAKHFLSNSGVVYGAAMVFENDQLLCKHIRVDKEEHLHLLQGSKYVQSHTVGIYNLVRKDLSEGRTVLFSGTSCQVASLRYFIGANEKLYLVDLVCHGVPCDKLFKDYVNYIEIKNNCRVENISFRAKGKTYMGKETPYYLTIKCKKNDSNSFELGIPKSKSAYYGLFLSCAGYRESCYSCKYSTLYKPSDMTLGDFKPSNSEILDYGLDKNKTYSSILIQNNKGQELLNYVSELVSTQLIPLDVMLNHHNNLKRPSMISNQGKKMLDLYKKNGFEKLQRYVNRENLKMWVVKIVKKMKSR